MILEKKKKIYLPPCGYSYWLTLSFILERGEQIFQSIPLPQVASWFSRHPTIFYHTKINRSGHENTSNHITIVEISHQTSLRLHRILLFVLILT